MSGNNMTDIATKVPTEVGDLSDCALPQNVIKQYGERLVTSINAYIEKESLQQYVENRPKKKQKTEPIVLDGPDDDDEFGDGGIDFTQVPMPVKSAASGRDPLSHKSEKPNPYNQKKLAASKKPAAKAGSKLKSKKSSYF